MSLGKVPQALWPLQMEAGKEETGPDCDPWAISKNRLEGARVDVGRPRGGSVVLQCRTAPHPGEGPRPGGSANLERTSDPPTGWAGLQVHVFVHNRRTLPDIVFSRPLSQSLHWVPSTLACKHLPLGQYSYNYYNYYLLQEWGRAFCLHYLIESPLQ